MIELIFDYFVYSKTFYSIEKRAEDNFIHDATDEEYQAAPADPYDLLTEDTIIKGQYSKSIDEVWQDGIYIVSIYEQKGVSPAPAADDKIGSGQIIIRNGQQVHTEISIC